MSIAHPLFPKLSQFLKEEVPSFGYQKKAENSHRNESQQLFSKRIGNF
jgi:hypothetical protein